MGNNFKRASWLAGTSAAVAGLVGLGYGNLNLQGQVAEVEAQLTRTQEELVGYTSYTTYLAKGKQSLREQAKFLAASVVREDHWIEHARRDLYLLHSEGTVILKVAAEYSFGFDLSPDKFDIAGNANGIQVSVGKPMLVATPSVTLLSYEFPSKGLLVNEEQVALELMKRLPDDYAIKGRAMANDEAIKALCEKKLVGFLRAFLEKQPGVTAVPNITIVYPA
jgi:hypothetical protein